MAKQELTEQEIVRLCELIKNGEKLPAQYREMLFGKETKKAEYELRYGCKERDVDVINNTYSAPFQKIKTFNPEGVIDYREYVRGKQADKNQEAGWYNKLIFGDNLQVLKNLLTDPLLQKQIKKHGGIKLIYIDPPFATKRDFQGQNTEKAYSDKVAGAEFIEFIRKRLIIMRELLADNGSIFIHLDQKKSHYIKVILDEVFGEHNFRNEILTRRAQTKNLQGQFERVKSLNVFNDTIFWYSKNPDTRFNPPMKEATEKQQTESWQSLWSNADRPTMRYDLLGSSIEKGQWKWSKERALLAVENYQKYLDALVENEKLTLCEFWEKNNSEMEFIRRTGKGKPQYWIRPRDEVFADNNWFDIKAYDYFSGYPTQKGESLLERIINIGTGQGDIVLDAFAGSGTTIAVAEKLGRKWIGVDCGKLAIYTIQKRLLNLKQEIGNKGEPLTPKPFAVYNAGLYDFRVLENLEWKTYVWFVLSLFECQQEEHNIDGIKMDGFYKLDHVQVFDYNHGREGISLDYGYIDNLEETIGKKLGKRVFIIAPATRVDFLETTVSRGAREYIILRVPYSIINELNINKDFRKIEQPKSESDVNNTVEAVGFDFMRAPKVTVGYSKKKNDAIIEIKTFSSKVISKVPVVYENLETLSLVMIDYEYDMEVKEVDFEVVVFSDEIRKNENRIILDVKRLEKPCMVIYMDIFGNKKREVISIENFK